MFSCSHRRLSSEYIYICTRGGSAVTITSHLVFQFKIFLHAVSISSEKHWTPIDTHTHQTKYIMYWGQPQHHRHRPVITAFELEIEFIPVLETNICWRIISWTRLSRAEASISLVFYRPAALISLLARQISCFHVLVEWERVCVCVRRRPFNPTSELTVY